MATRSKDDTRPLAANRAAAHDYHLLQRFEAGMVLLGTEVKSARQGKVNLKDAYAKVERGEMILFDAHFSPYTEGNRQNHEPLRPRKLLLHAKEIRKLAKETEAAGVTIVPTKIYVKNGRIKVELALARGKKVFDKREASRRREAEQDMARARAGRSAR